MSAVLDFILKTNLFNFIIFAGIITFLIIKLDIIGGLDRGKNLVAEDIEESKTCKEESEKNLMTIEERVSHLEEEIETIVNASIENAEVVGKRILEEAEKNADNIRENAKKNVENKVATLKNEILKRASSASVEVARNHIINELNNNYDLHIKLIDESLNALDEVEV